MENGKGRFLNIQMYMYIECTIVLLHWDLEILTQGHKLTALILTVPLHLALCSSNMKCGT